MRIKNGFVLRKVCNENVIVDEEIEAINFDKMFVLNESAAWLWEQAQAMGNFTIETLAEKLCEAYDVTPDEAKADVAEIIADWQKVDVVE
jgi:hypothetical protein